MEKGLNKIVFENCSWKGDWHTNLTFFSIFLLGMIGKGTGKNEGNEAGTLRILVFLQTNPKESRFKYLNESKTNTF